MKTLRFARRASRNCDRNPAIAKWIASVLLLLCLTSNANAAPGDLDASFGGTGLIRTGFGGGIAEARSAAVQADGKIVIAGYGAGDDTISRIIIVRLNTNNAIDPSFGREGRVVMDITNQSTGSYSDVGALRIQPDGKIVVAGYAFHGSNYTVGLVARLNLDGSFDSTFSHDGKAYCDLGSNGRFTAMSLQGDGKIIAAGWVYPPSSQQRFIVARFNTNGMLDTSFGTNGVEAMTSFGGGATASIIQSDGRILVVGQGGNEDFVVTRSTTNGVLDSTFGEGDGYTITRFPFIQNYTPDATPTAVGITSGDTILSPDKIIVSGYAARGSVSNVIAIARYNFDGTPDTNFGSNGTTSAAITSSPSGDYAQSMWIQGIGKTKRIVIAGHSYLNPQAMFIARFTAGGAFDTSFASGTGKETISLSGAASCNTMLIQGGGYLLIGGLSLSENNEQFAAVRVATDGTLDSTFGSNGLVTADVADRAAVANGVAVQTDGKTVAVGYANDGARQHFALARYNADGSLDQSFGVSGKVVSKFSTNDYASCVAIQSDGKILAAGSTSFPPNNYFAVARYNQDGSLDSSFGVNGWTNFFASGECRTIKIQPDGKILLAGDAYPGSYTTFAMARLTTSGTLDPSFGGGVGVTTAFLPTPSLSMATGILPTPNGIYLTGFVEFVSGGSSVDENFALTHYNTNGAIDFSFGNSGRLTTDFNGGTLDSSMASVMQPDGKFILAGATAIAPNSYLALARYNPNGSLDSSFGNGGLVISQVGFSSDTINALALQTNGKIVAAGNTSVAALNKFFAARYNADGSFDDSFGMGGVAYVDFGTDTNETCNAMALDKFGRTVLVGDGGGLFGIARLASENMLNILGISRMTNGHMLMNGTGFPSVSHTVLGSPTLNGTFTGIGTVTPDASGNWQYEDSSTDGVASRFYRLSYP